MNTELINETLAFRAFVERDPQYEGQFFAAVKTTGIFCRPTCRAKKPARENVVFYATAGEAIAGGYRPCKICRPMELPGETPPSILSILHHIEAAPEEKISDARLRQMGISPGPVKRYFQKNYGMSFHAFNRMLRIHRALQNMRNGEKVIDTAFGSGYESLSGFQHSFKKITSKNPTDLRGSDVLLFDRLSTPLGPMLIVADSRGKPRAHGWQCLPPSKEVCHTEFLCPIYSILLLEFTDRRGLERELADLKRQLQSEILPGTNEHMTQLKAEITDYFAGNRKEFRVSIIPIGTEFQKQVWTGLIKIPYGTTTSYAEQARGMDRPKAVRAVAHANGSNRLAILIPCHRVLSSDGGLAGYSGGVARKRWLIEHERKHNGRTVR